jgi:hypothetical protein
MGGRRVEGIRLRRRAGVGALYGQTVRNDIYGNLKAKIRKNTFAKKYAF